MSAACRARRDQFNDLRVFRKPILRVLGKHYFSVNGDVKDSRTSFDQARFDLKLTGNLGLQTGGLGQIVSLTAVGNGDVHLEKFLAGKNEWI